MINIYLYTQTLQQIIYNDNTFKATQNDCVK